MSRPVESIEKAPRKIDFGYALFNGILVGGLMWIMNAAFHFFASDNPIFYASFGFGSALGCVIKDLWGPVKIKEAKSADRIEKLEKPSE